MEKGFIYYGIRISFWIMILAYIGYTSCFMFADDYYSLARDFTSVLVPLMSIINMGFCISFLLKNKNEKEFAIVSLILSLLFLFLRFFPCSSLLPK